MLLTLSAGYAQDQSTVISDVTPQAWNFDKLEKGSAGQYFFRQAASTGSNFRLPANRTDGRTGFRWADNSTTGGFGVALWGTGLPDNGYDSLTVEWKNKLERYYNTWQITDGGKMGNILIYKGVACEENDLRAATNPDTLNCSVNTYWVTHPDIEVGEGVFYRYTLRLRAIVPTKVGIDCYIGTSWWDGIPFAGSNRSTGYGNFAHTCYPEENQYWTEYVFEVEAKQMGTLKPGYTQYDIAPLLLKVGLNSNAVDRSILMFDDLKMERVSQPTVQGEVEKTLSSGKIYYYGYVKNEWGEGYDDASDYVLPSNVSAPEAKDLIVLTEGDEVTVVDAEGLVSAYDASGRLVDTAEPNNCLAKLNIPGHGIFVIKTATQSKKIVK